MVSGRFLPRLAACRCANRPNSTSLVLDGSRVKPNFLSRLHILTVLETQHKVVDISDQAGLAPQPGLDHALEPKVEHIMQIYVAQQDADRTALWRSPLVRMNLAILQDTCL